MRMIYDSGMDTFKPGVGLRWIQLLIFGKIETVKKCGPSLPSNHLWKGMVNDWYRIMVWSWTGWNWRSHDPRFFCVSRIRQKLRRQKRQVCAKFKCHQDHGGEIHLLFKPLVELLSSELGREIAWTGAMFFSSSGVFGDISNMWTSQNPVYPARAWTVESLIWVFFYLRLEGSRLSRSGIFWPLLRVCSWVRVWMMKKIESGPGWLNFDVLANKGGIYGWIELW